MPDDLSPELEADETSATDTPKKRITRKKVTAPKRQPVSEPIAAAEIVPAELEPVPIDDRPVQKREINEFLTNLYKDENGKIPSMQTLTMKKSNTLLKTIVGLLGVLVIGAALLWAGFFFLPSGQTNQDNQASISIQGMANVSLGATTTYSIAYSNNSDATFKNVVVNAYFPDGFVFTDSNPRASNSGHNEWKIGTLGPHAQGTIQVTGLPFGSVNEPKSWRVFMNYTPTNFNSELQKAATLTTVIANSPVALTISGPDKAAVGSPVAYTFSVIPAEGFNLPMQVIPELPDNFSVSSAQPKLNAGGQWLVNINTSTSSTPNGGPYTFTIQGTFTAGSSSTSPLKAFVYLAGSGKQNYQIAAAELSSELVQNDVNVNVAINGAVTDFSVKPGDMLNITVRVKNSSANEIKNATVKLVLTTPALGKQAILQWSDIADKYDGNILGEQISNSTRRGTIVWNSKQIPALAKLKPNDDVTIDLQIPIKDGKQIDLGSVVLATSTAVASIDFTDSTKAAQKIATEPLNITLNSDLSFTNDDLVSSNAASRPVHTISWTLSNTFHKLKDVNVSASVFGDTTVSITKKDAGTLTYDQSQNKVIWTIPEINLATDVLNSAFNITINKNDPSQSLLLSKVHITATDAVTGQTIDIGGDEVKLNQPTQ